MRDQTKDPTVPRPPRAPRGRGGPAALLLLAGAVLGVALLRRMEDRVIERWMSRRP
jgi:hypothetical protein